VTFLFYFVTFYVILLINMEWNCLNIRMRKRYRDLMAILSNAGKKSTGKDGRSIVSDFDLPLKKLTIYFEKYDDIFRSCVYQLEKSEKGVLHIQLFVQLVKPLDQSNLKKKLLKASGLNFCRTNSIKSLDNQIPWNYCCKPTGNWKSLSGKLHYSETVSSNYKIRPDLFKRRITKLKEKPGIIVFELARDVCKSPFEACEENPQAMSNNYRFFEYVRSNKFKELSQKRRNVSLFLYLGCYSDGVMEYIFSKNDSASIYLLDLTSKNVWFNGYDPGRENILFIPDLDPVDLSKKLLNRYLSGYSQVLDIKGGYTFANWDKVFISTSVSLSSLINTYGIFFKNKLTKVYKFAAPLLVSEIKEIDIDIENIYKSEEGSLEGSEVFQSLSSETVKF